MADFESNSIRNVCLASHGGTGKTTLTEAILFNAGAIDRIGKVVEGNTTTDFDPEETKRHISISTSLATCQWKNHKLNLIDTPGYFDFVGELKQGIQAADAVVIPVSAKDGVAVGTEKAWENAEQMKIPRIFFINKMDEENANLERVFNQLRDTFGSGVVPIQWPIIENNKFKGNVDMLAMKAYQYDGSKPVEIAIPDALKQTLAPYREMLVEAVAETDETLLEEFSNGQEFTRDEIIHGLRTGIADLSITPVLCGSASDNVGVLSLMDEIVELLPSFQSKGEVRGYKPDSQEVISRKTSITEPFSAMVFKTIADPFVGKITLFKVNSGILKPDSNVLNSSNGKTEKVSQLFTLRGKKQLPQESAVTGDIAAVAKLQFTNTGDTLCDPSKPIVFDRIAFPIPSISMGIEPKSKGDEEKIGNGLHKLLEEDPTFKIENNTETKQLLISGVGEQHLDVIVNKLKTKFGVSVNLTPPKIPYRETIKKKVKTEGKHKKQSGGHGQYGHVWIEFEPGATQDLTFEEKIFGGAVPKQYIPAVEKGLRESITKGILAGYPVVNLKATLVDGSFHPVDSSEMAFKVAASLAYKKGLSEASPTLLEPIGTAKVLVPSNFMGDIIGDLNKRRGRIMGMNSVAKGVEEVTAEVPMSEMFTYATELRSMTQGRGNFDIKFERYEEVPSNMAVKIIEEAKKNMKEEEDE